MADTADPLLIGGTGRSGTHALARIVGRHSRFESITFELKLHADPPGLPGLLAGKVSLDSFLADLRGQWWSRQDGDGKVRGLVLKVVPEDFEAAVESFAADFPGDPHAAAGTLLRSLLDPVAAAAGKSTWVENTNRNVAAGPMLLRMLPDARFVHIFRDGRDVAASLVKQSFGPSRLSKALDWWERRLTKTEAGAAELPPERLLTLAFEDLVIEDREGTYRRIVEFLGAGDDPDMRARFDVKTSPAKANIGRWADGLSGRAANRLNRRYREALERLVALESPGRPLFERALALLDG
jgi:hypothetical protein